jgi:hypothetical protein
VRTGPPTILTLLLALAAACGSANEGLRGPEAPRPSTAEVERSDDDPVATAPPEAPDFAHRIDDLHAWSLLAARPDSVVFARTEVVKFLIDLEDERKLYFPQTARWDIHYDFARQFLHSDERPVESHAAFNVREYRTPGRRFVCGSVVRYLDADVWTFEILAGDNLEGERVLRAFEQVRDAVFFGDQLKYRPLSELNEREIAPVANRIPTITTDELLGDLQYQPLTQGVTYGYLRIVRGRLDMASVRRNEIILTDHVPPDLPLSMGLVTGAIQAPLSHVAVLSQNRGTPNMALRGAADDRRFTALDGRLVRLYVGPQDFKVEPADQQTATQYWADLRPARPFTPQVDNRERRLLDLCDLNANAVSVAGAKAAQLSEVCPLAPRIATPGGFVIPFHHYQQHLERNDLDDGIAQMLVDGDFRDHSQVRSQRLEELRDIIDRLPVDPQLIRQVRRKVAAFGQTRTIFRSSTNAEDLIGFNGAGLYRSVVVDADPSSDDIENAIREVWASVWTLRGYDERDFYRIDHRNVAMAILVQPFVADVIASGVAITRNPFNPNRPGVFINIQVSSGSVTDAGEDVPEQHLVYTYPDTPEPEILSRSSLTDGQPILREADVLRLTEILVELDERMRPHYTAPANAVDVEFLMTRNREMVVVQARPYTVVYTSTPMIVGGG